MKEVCQFGYGRGNSAQDLVSAVAGQNDPIASISDRVDERLFLLDCCAVCSWQWVFPRNLGSSGKVI